MYHLVRALGALQMVFVLACGSVVTGDPDADTVDGLPEDTAEDGTGTEDGHADADDGGPGDGDVGPGCGNGRVDPSEECDDGPANSDTEPDACRTDCREAHCGDGVTDDDELCDDGNDLDGDGCDIDCRYSCTRNADCDDGRVCNGAEACTDRVCADGPDPTDGLECTTPDGGAGVCRTGLCSPGRCGDGHPGPDEVCDDGNDDNTDACLNDCREASCDDGFVWAGREDCEGDATRPCTTGCGTAGQTVCDDCRWAAECTPPREICNGADDDCDTTPDDAFPCAAGSRQSCPLGAGCLGVQTCSATCAWGTCSFAAEVCNGLDDDCDGGTDEGFGCAAGAMESCTAGSCPGTRTCSAACGWGGCEAPPVVGDRCPASITIPSAAGSYRYTGTLCGATNDFNLTCGTVTGVGRDVVLRMELPASRIVTFSTHQSTVDTLLFVIPAGGAACPGGTAGILCNDNDRVGSTTASRICTTLPAGEYFIVLDTSVAAAIDTWVLDVVVGTSTPANDACAAAVTLTPDTTLRTQSGTTLGADDDHANCLGPGAPARAPDVWYKIVIPAGGRAVYLSTQDAQTWDSILALHSGSCTGPLFAPGGCADDACGNQRSKFVGILPAGDWYLAVDGYAAGGAGPFQLSYQASPCVAAFDADPVTPGYADPINTASTTGLSWTGTMAGMGDDSRGSCVPTVFGTHNDIYFYMGLCPGESGLQFTTCHTFTSAVIALYARYGNCTTPGSADPFCDLGSVCSLGGVPATGRISLSATAQGLYYLWLDPSVGESPNWGLSFSR